MAARLRNRCGRSGQASTKGLTMTQRKAITGATATRYRSASKGAKAVILDELCGDHGLAPRPRPQSAATGAQTQADRRAA